MAVDFNKHFPGEEPGPDPEEPKKPTGDGKKGSGKAPKRQDIRRAPLPRGAQEPKSDTPESAAWRELRGELRGLIGDVAVGAWRNRRVIRENWYLCALLGIVVAGGGTAAVDGVFNLGLADKMYEVQVDPNDPEIEQLWDSAVHEIGSVAIEIKQQFSD